MLRPSWRNIPQRTSTSTGWFVSSRASKRRSAWSSWLRSIGSPYRKRRRMRRRSCRRPTPGNHEKSSLRRRRSISPSNGCGKQDGWLLQRALSRMHTDTTEKGLEDLILAVMTGDAEPAAPTGEEVRERPAIYGALWILGEAKDYNREYAVDLAQLTAFLQSTQPKVAEALDLAEESPARHKFLSRLQGEVSKRGVVDVLRLGIRHGPWDI